MSTFYYEDESPRVIYTNHSTAVIMYNYDSIFRYGVKFRHLSHIQKQWPCPSHPSVLNGGFPATTPVSIAEMVVIGARNISSLMLKDASNLWRKTSIPFPPNTKRNADVVEHDVYPAYPPTPRPLSPPFLETGKVIRSGWTLLSDPTEFAEPTKVPTVPKSPTFSKDFHIMSRIKTLDKLLKAVPEYNVQPLWDHYERCGTNSSFGTVLTAPPDPTSAWSERCATSLEMQRNQAHLLSAGEFVSDLEAERRILRNT